MLGTVSALVLLLVVPGPTNTLLLRAGVLFGFAASWRLAFIECVAYLLQVSVWGGALLTNRTWLTPLKINRATSIAIGCFATLMMGRLAGSVLH